MTLKVRTAKSAAKEKKAEKFPLVMKITFVTLYPTYEMSLESFFELVRSLPWEKTGIFT